jgi:RNA polymerase sigma-70 factor (ECF subfamily)
VSIEPEPTDAFEAVVRRAGPAMLAYARRRVDPDTAEDVVAEALLVLWRRRAELSRPDVSDRRADEVAWAIGVTRGCLANARRSSRRHLTLVGRLARLERPPPGTDSSASSDADEVLHAALTSLREEEQELLRLWAWDDLKPAQIAVVLGVAPEVVSVRLHRAKKRLAALLESPAARTRTDASHLNEG